MRIFFCIPLVAAITTLNAQTRVTFSVDMAELTAMECFRPDQGEQVIVRGTFNAWTGENHVLERGVADHRYRGTFLVDASLGDTLEYKYVIERRDGRVYWERDPNPGLPPNGNRQFVVTGQRVDLPEVVFDYDEFVQQPVVFSKEKLHEDFLQLRKTVEEYHPALYDYTDKSTLDSLFEAQFATITGDQKLREFHTTVSRVLAQVGCGHTKVWMPRDYWNAAPDRFFPLKLLFHSTGVFVRGAFTDSVSIPIGSEVASLNGMPIVEIVRTLKSLTSSDALIDAFQSSTVERNFAKRFALRYGYPEHFVVDYIAPGDSVARKVELLPVGLVSIESQPARGSELSLQLLREDETGIITINTFIYYENVEEFRSFIDSSFRAIVSSGIDNLIIDLRGNDGGNPFCASYLLAHIEQKPVPYFSEAYHRYEALADPIPLARNHFTGHIYVLIDGSAFSTTGHLCGLLKYHRIGELVGTETGGTYTCTGSVHYADLANTRLILGTAQKRRYSVAVRGLDRTAGITPDYVVEQAPADLVLGRDTVLEFVLGLVRSGE